MSGGIDWHVCSNWAAQIQPTVALIGPALWGEPGEAPPMPEDPDERPFWEDECALRERLGGGTNPEYQRFMEEGRHLVYLHCREAVGTGGYRGECAHYGLKAAELPIEYASCHRRTFGQYYPATWRPPVEAHDRGARGLDGRGHDAPAAASRRAADLVLAAGAWLV